MIRPEHYPIVGENLLATIEELLNPGEEVLTAGESVRRAGGYLYSARSGLYQEKRLYRADGKDCVNSA